MKENTMTKNLTKLEENLINEFSKIKMLILSVMKNLKTI